MTPAVASEDDPYRLLLNYVSSPPLPMPLRHPGNEGVMTVTELNVSCAVCEGCTEGLRGSTIDHPQCLDVRVAGVCPRCRHVTWVRFRIYPTHVLVWGERGLREHAIGKPSAWRRVVEFLGA